MTTKRALVCAPLMPEFDRESGSKRIFDLCRFLRDAGWAVSFAAENGRGGDRYASILRQRGISTYSGFDGQYGLAELIVTGRFDLAIMAFWHIAETCLPMIRSLSPTTRVVVDSIDLHFLRNARRLFREAAARSHLGVLDAEFADQLAREVNVYAAADAVLTVSQKEADFINDLVGTSRLARAVPDGEELAPSKLPFADRTGILFVGNFRHPPNVQAAEYLCRDILPRIKRSVTAEHPVYVVGNGLSMQALRLSQTSSGVRMVGWVPSMVPYLERCRISVVPLLYGAGTKRKLIQTLMVGTPTVSTSVGVEGLNLCDGEHVLVADSPDAFAAAVIRLLTDEPLWEQLAARGREQIAVTHSREAARQRFLDVVSDVLASTPVPVSVISPSRLPPQASARRPGAYLVATPNPVPYSPGLGTTTIVWNTGSGDRGQVRLARLGRAELMFAEGTSGSAEAPWIRSGETYEFRLYAGERFEDVVAAATVIRPVEVNVRNGHHLFHDRSITEPASSGSTPVKGIRTLS